MYDLQPYRNSNTKEVSVESGLYTTALLCRNWVISLLSSKGYISSKYLQEIIASSIKNIKIIKMKCRSGLHTLKAVQKHNNETDFVKIACDLAIRSIF